MNQYRIPKRPIPAELVLVGQPRAAVQVFLSERLDSATGFERPSELLAGELEFIPAMKDDAPLVFRRDAVVVMTVDAVEEVYDNHPLAQPYAAEDVTRLDVELDLEGGERIAGTVAFVQPEARRRLGDWLNDAEPFLCVQDIEKAHLVNRARIVAARARR